MKLINYRKKDVVANESWAIAIKNRFGDAQSLLMKLNPDVQGYCSDRLEMLCTDDTIPTLVRLSLAYSPKVADALLNVHLTEALISMGEQSIDANEIKLIARTIRADERLRTLNIAMVLHFFKRLKSGQYKIFGAVTPRKVLEAMQSFYNEAIELQRRFSIEHEKAERKAEREAYEREAITFAQYAKLHNLKGDNPLAKFGLNTSTE
ncbi:MAG: hypothetical protein RR383_09970 [Muribaculaceae bacterium]